MVKSRLAVFVAACGLSLAGGAAHATSPDRLLQSCQAIIRTTGNAESRSVGIPVAGLACWYYMAAVQDLSVVVDQNGRHLLGVCAPKNTTLMQYVRIFARYAKGHPNESADGAGALALRGLVRAFPCRPATAS